MTGRTLQRSVTFHGSEAEAEAYRAELAAEYAARRSVSRAAPMLTVGELLDPSGPHRSRCRRCIAAPAAPQRGNLPGGTGEILQAQARLGHRDAATTLREYPFALPATDGDVADAIDEHLEGGYGDKASLET